MSEPLLYDSVLGGIYVEPKPLASGSTPAGLVADGLGDLIDMNSRVKLVGCTVATV